MSRNIVALMTDKDMDVTSREGRVSRNTTEDWKELECCCHVPRGTCE